MKSIYYLIVFTILSCTAESTTRRIEAQISHGVANALQKFTAQIDAHDRVYLIIQSNSDTTDLFIFSTSKNCFPMKYNCVWFNESTIDEHELIIGCYGEGILTDINLKHESDDICTEYPHRMYIKTVQDSVVSCLNYP